MKGMTLSQIAQKQSKGNHRLVPGIGGRGEARNHIHGRPRTNVDVAAMKEIPQLPERPSSASATAAPHVQFPWRLRVLDPAFGRMGCARSKLMTLEYAVRAADLRSASTFGLYDRGLLRPGMNRRNHHLRPDTVKPLPEFVVPRLPGRRLALQGAGRRASTRPSSTARC